MAKTATRPCACPSTGCPSKAADAAKPAPSAPPGGLSVLELFAVNAVGKLSGKWREHLEAGDEQPVDFFLRVSGTLNVAEGQTATVATKPDLETMLAIAFDLLGEKTAEKLFHAWIDRYAAIVDPKRVEELPLDCGRRAREVVELLSVSKIQQRAGNVVGQLEVARMPGPEPIKPYKRRAA